MKIIKHLLIKLILSFLSLLRKFNKINTLFDIYFEKYYMNGDKQFVPPGHFYSPIVNVGAIKLTNEIPLTLPGIKISKRKHEVLFKKFLPHIKKIKFNQNYKIDKRYFLNNPSFGIADAYIYNAFLKEFQPKRVIEVGSGYSSALLLDSLDELKINKNVTFIEPYPNDLNKILRDSDRTSVNIIQKPVQDVPKTFFSQLNKNDLLFIDSTHVLKTNSDVLYELTEILPSLKKGVYIHLHDIFWPFEYPNSWILEENRSWNELYALRIFLMNQDEYEVIFMNSYAGYFLNFNKNNPFPFDENRGWGGSIYLRKTK